MSRLTIYTAWQAFQELCDRSSPHTSRAYRTDVSKYARFLKQTPEESLYELLQSGPDAARARVTEWVKRMSRTLAANTVSRRLTALKSFVSHSTASGLVDWKLNVAPPKKLRSALSKEEKMATAQRDMSGPQREGFKRLIADLDRMASASPNPTDLASEDERISAIRDLAMIALLENPALRRSEVCGLNVKDFSRGRDASVTFIGKGRSEPETLPVGKRTAAYVLRWLRLRGGSPSDPLFTRFRRPGFGNFKGRLIITDERLSPSALYTACVQRGAAVLGLHGSTKNRRMNPHSLRHTGVTKLAILHARGDLTLKQAMAVSRHKKADTFMRYVDSVNGASRKAVNQMEDM